jgi:hypothetical protein
MFGSSLRHLFCNLFTHTFCNMMFLSVTRRVTLVEQKLLTLPDHLSSSPCFSGIRVLDLVSFVLFLLFIVLSVDLGLLIVPLVYFS